ncbi:MAG TPA: SAM-dependent methyltransferase [Xanthobacteraceae bacterium]
MPRLGDAGKDQRKLALTAARPLGMDDGRVHDVSDTAFMVAAYRAMESERPDALFRDPLAAKLAGTRGRKIVEKVSRWPFLGEWFVAVRTCVIDALIETVVAEGIDTVLNLGAGLDTRPYRMGLPHELRWIEVDYPKIIELKESCLREQAPCCRLERVKLDLAETRQRQQLLSRIAGESERALVLSEGLIPYWSTDEVALLAADLRARHAFRYWIVDYLSPMAKRYRVRIGLRMNMQKALFRFDPDDYFAFFRGQGWALKDIRYISEEAEKLNRPLQGPRTFRISLKFMQFWMTKSHRNALGKSAAYVLLEPANPTANL